jgi:HlyD family secretion protein
MNLRTVSWTIVGLGVAAAAAWYLFAAEPVAVDTAQASRGSIEVTVTAEGETRVREVYSISAPITGKLERLNRHVGDKVAKGQRVASLRPVDPPIRDVRSRLELAAATRASEAAVGVAEAQVRQANSALTFARAEFDRASELVKRKVISQAAMDQAELNIRVREAELKQAEAALELRRQELATARAREMEPLQLSASVSEDQCCMAVAAPVAGTVLRIVTESEQVVQAGAPILELGDTADLEIVVDLLSTDAVGILPGMEARIEDWGGEGLLEAKVRRIDPAGFTKVSALGIEEQRVNAILDFTGPPERRASLGHAFKVLVRIVRSRAEDALQVPIGALFRHNGNWAAYTVEDDVARLKELELGRFSMAHAEVLGGLSDADTVIVHPGDQVADGVAVRRR